MDSRLIFLHCARRLNREGRIYKLDPTISRVGWGPGNGAPRGQLVAEVWGAGAEKSSVGTMRASVPQTDTGRRGEYPQALERTVLKELGNLTP